jgi:hypothetical protein
LAVADDFTPLNGIGIHPSQDSFDHLEVRMATHFFHEFPQDEQDDVTAGVAAEGFDIGEFTISDEDRYPAGGKVGPIRRQVTVNRLLNNTTRIYDIADGTSWTVGFERDLAAGAFGG